MVGCGNSIGTSGNRISENNINKKEMKKVTLGGDRLGAGKRMKVELHGYERSTHDLSYLWRSTMAPGTLVPFMTELGLPGDTFDIDLDIDVKTHPTVGPLFGTFKVQADVFMVPVRLYQGLLHNNKLGVGMRMATVRLPQLKFEALWKNPEDGVNIDNAQVNPSSLLAYLNMMGAGRTPDGSTNEVRREFNAVPYIAYWDIYKNYYANKQEEIGALVNNPLPVPIATVTTVNVTSGVAIPMAPAAGVEQQIARSSEIRVNFSGAKPSMKQVMFETNKGIVSGEDMFSNVRDNGNTWVLSVPKLNTSELYVYRWRYIDGADIRDQEPQVETFPLANIDQFREAILGADTSVAPVVINGNTLAPFGNVLRKDEPNGFYSKMSALSGLGLKTYQSDLFNNWLKTEWIDGAGGINEITRIDTSDGGFSLDTLNLAQKVYNMLNRVAVSGGSYDDYLEATYSHEQYRKASSPMYMGGLSKELIFQEVVSTNDGIDGEGILPLGTLAGKGRMSDKHKGGRISIKVDEPSYVMGIISLTPRIDYSQGNKWDVNLKTMDDFHKPALDEIGFQDLITDQMAWWDTVVPAGEGNQAMVYKSAGKQPAWLNYMTNVNQVRGNFAIRDNEMFMTLNRRYEFEEGVGIQDLTTYIDPVKFNQIFAQTSRDAQNMWTQIRVGIEARRKMSAKVMPNL